MKIQCNSLLEAPIINLIKLHSSLNTVGVCGIITPGTRNSVSGTTVSSLALLSYCNELQVNPQLQAKLHVVNVSLAKGGLTYDAIANVSNGILTAPAHLSKEPFMMLTDNLDFSIMVGLTTSNDPLMDNDLFKESENHLTAGKVFTPVPMPLLSQKVLKFKVNQDSGKSTIECEDLEQEILFDLIKSLADN